MWRDEAAEAAKKACLAARISSDLRPVSAGTSLVYRSGSSVVKVSHTAVSGESGRAEVALARALRARGVETPAPRWATPYEEARWRVTAFEAVLDPRTDPVDPAILGSLARELSSIDVAVNRVDPVGTALRFFGAAVRSGVVPTPTLERLTRHASRLRTAFEELGGETFLHGDLATENVLVREDGTPVLLGLSGAGYGPPEWESSAFLLGPRFFGTEAREVGSFVASYGAPIRLRAHETALAARAFLSAARYAAAAGCGSAGYTRGEARSRIGRVLTGRGPEWSAPGTRSTSSVPTLAASS